MGVKWEMPHRFSLGRGNGMRPLALLCYRLIPRDVGWAKAVPCPSRSVIAVMAQGFHFLRLKIVGRMHRYMKAHTWKMYPIRWNDGYLSRYSSPNMDDCGPVYLYEMRDGTGWN